MNREQLIQSIVARKLANPEKNKVFCICFCVAATSNVANRQPAAKAAR